LGQNYPNPFNPLSTICFDLPVASKTVLRIFDVSGCVVATLVDRFLEAGRCTVTWDGGTEAGNPVVSGVYFYRLEVGDFVAVRKMVLPR